MRPLRFVDVTKFGLRQYADDVAQVPTRKGRPRDAVIDEAVLATARQHLAVHGLTGLSIAAVAEEAGTTRPSLYRRWPTKLQLAVAAVADLAEVAPPEPTDDPFEDLVAELAHFRHCITDASSLALAGLMLQEDVEPEFQREYREHLVKPRRARLRACFERAIIAGELPADADLTVATTMATGSWYAFSVGGVKPPRDWPRRTATLIWRACGGKPR